MSLSVRPDYVDPLTVKRQRTGLAGVNPLRTVQKDPAGDIEKLELQKQTVQNQLLLTKSSTESSAALAESQEILEGKLEQISAELQSAKTQDVLSPVSEDPRFDEYIKDGEGRQSPGLYMVKPDEEEGYRVTFEPYSEEEKEEPAEEKEEKEEVQEREKNLELISHEVKTLKREKKVLELQISQAEQSGKSEEELKLLRARLDSLENTLDLKGKSIHQRQLTAYH